MNSVDDRLSSTMSFSDNIWKKLFMMNRNKLILFLILIISCLTSAENIFQSGKKYTYSYFVESNTGVLVPGKASSSWGMQGFLTLETHQSLTQIQLNNLKVFVWNGEFNDQSKSYIEMEDEAKEILKPFQVNYEDGLVTNFSVLINESLWATNIKRSIAGILQLNLTALEKHIAFYSRENNHYGNCNIECVSIPETNSNNDERWIRKFLDPRTCKGHPQWTWSNVLKMQCPTGDESPVTKSSERLYKVKNNKNNLEIKFINATSGIYVQPFQSLGEAQFLLTRQIFELIDIEDLKNTLSSDNFHQVGIYHELVEDDLSQGRGIYEKNHIFQSISALLDRLSQRLENPGLDADIDNLHNSTISILLYYLRKLNRNDLQAAFNKFSGTSYKEETMRNMFLEVLPQVGSKESALFILDIIQQKKVSDFAAMQLLTQLPFHIRKSDIKLLTDMEPLIDLPEKVSTQVQYTAILTFGTLIYKQCLVDCPYEMLDDYVRLYLDKFTESDNFEKKMIWLEGLANIQLGKVVEFLESIAESTANSRHLRVLAAWSSLPTAPSKPDVIYPVYWPILVNRTEHLEMRIAALTLLIISDPSSNRIISLYMYMQSEPDLHLVNYFYTTLKSMEDTSFPCYKQAGLIARKFARILQKFKNKQNVITGNYLFDYQDTKRNFGAMIQNFIITSSRSNVPEVAYIGFNSHGSGTQFNQISLYVSASGLMHSLSKYLENPGQVKNVLNEFKIENKTSESPHIEIIVRIQNKAVLCLHFNQTNIADAITYLTSLPENTFQLYQKMEFHINHQRINIPMNVESIQVTDFGTNVRLAATANSLLLFRGNFTYFLSGRNNHVILRTAIHGTEVVESYNPLIDTWHLAERTQSIHGYLFTNISIGFQDRFFLSYNTPPDYLTSGLTAHARTTTGIKDISLDQKFKKKCPDCVTLYTVKKNPNAQLQDEVIYETELPELGGRVKVKVFNCEEIVDQNQLLTDIWSSHQSNYKIWSGAKLGLLGMHILDYFSYLPPKGSCGLSICIDPIDAKASEVKFEYGKNGKHHMLSLTRKEMDTDKILQQWTLAILYEFTSWVSDSIKVKATRTIPGEKVMKACIEVHRIAPWTWDYFSLKPSDSALIKSNMIWGLSDTAKGKCTGSSLAINLLGEISDNQIKESHENKWPYNECRKQSKEKSIVPYSEACYQASRELSTLRKYQIFVNAVNLPETMTKFIWKLRALYDLTGGNSSLFSSTNQFVIEATFPKDQEKSLMHVNNETISIQYNEKFINVLLTRTRLHRYLDNQFLRAFFSPCILTPSLVISSYNITRQVKKDSEYLVLGQCYDENPAFVLTAISSDSGVTLNIIDNKDNLRIVPNQNVGTVYNNTDKISITEDFEWNTIGEKSIRMDKKSMHIVLGNILPFIHFTKDQILLFYPNYIQEFSCGVCAVQTYDTFSLYEKIL